MDPNVVLPSHHESQLPLAKQLDLSLTPPPVLFHVDDAEMASFAMPHVAERPASASSVVEMEMGLVPNIAPLMMQMQVAQRHGAWQKRPSQHHPHETRLVEV